MVAVLLDKCFTDAAGVVHCPDYMHPDRTGLYVGLGIALIFIVGAALTIVSWRSTRRRKDNAK